MYRNVFKPFSRSFAHLTAILSLSDIKPFIWALNICIASLFERAFSSLVENCVLALYNFDFVSYIFGFKIQ